MKRRIKLLNRIAQPGLDAMDAALYEVGEDVENPHGILVRSKNMHDMPLGADLLAIARAGAGVNNIPLKQCTRQGIVVFNTPGGNANSVKEMALLGMLLAARNVLGGIRWVENLGEVSDLAAEVETGKSNFVGHELMGHTLGVMGLGAVGGRVANLAHQLGMQVIGCDPFLSVEAAWGLSHSVQRADSYREMYPLVDYLTLHVPVTPDTRGMINQEALDRMRDGVKIINTARGELVNNQDMRKALDSGKVAVYVTDFPSPELVGHPKVISIPHLGASTDEAEDNCALMAANQLRNFLENGNIVNSVNFPAASMPATGDARICVIHDNLPGMLATLSSLMEEHHINIENMLNRSRGDIAYTIIETTGVMPPGIDDAVQAVQGVIRVHAIHSRFAASVLPR